MDAYYTRVGLRLLRRARNDLQFATDLIDGCAETRLSYETLLGYRAFDAICYLVSPARRTSTLAIAAAPTDLGSKAIYGETTLNPDLNFGYGVPKYVGLNTVRRIARSWREIGAAQLAAQYNVAEMRKYGVYKADTLRIREAQSYFDEFVLPIFSELKNFYSRAAAARQSVIVAFS